jgi:hypothetical protein
VGRQNSIHLFTSPSRIISFAHTPARTFSKPIFFHAIPTLPHPRMSHTAIFIFFFYPPLYIYLLLLSVCRRTIRSTESLSFLLTHSVYMYRSSPPPSFAWVFSSRYIYTYRSFNCTYFRFRRTLMLSFIQLLKFVLSAKDSEAVVLVYLIGMV